MPTPSDIPPSCEFDLDKLLLKLDEVLPSDVAAIDDMVTSITQLIAGTGCRGNIEKIDLALHEALANAILHGNRSNPEKGVRVCVAVQEGCGILMVVKDAGSGFDPDRLPNATEGQSLLAEHGRGVFLIDCCMDEVQFGFETGTEIYMRLHPEAAQNLGQSQ